MNIIDIYSDVTYKTGPAHKHLQSNWCVNKQRKETPHVNTTRGWQIPRVISPNNNIGCRESRVAPHQLLALTEFLESPPNLGTVGAAGYRHIPSEPGHLHRTSPMTKHLKCSKTKIQQTTKQCGHFHIDLPSSWYNIPTCMQDVLSQ